MDDLLDSLTNGHVTAVKVVLASVAAALACYQLVLIAVGFGKLRLGFLDGRPASSAHRAVGDTTALLLLVVAAMCIGYFGFGGGEDDRGGATFHIVTGSALLVVLALKVAVVRWWHGLGRLLPLLGTSVFVLVGLTWASSAGDLLT